MQNVYTYNHADILSSLIDSEIANFIIAGTNIIITLATKCRRRVIAIVW